MKAKFKNITSKIIITLMMLAFGFGCTTTKPAPNPLAGFHPDFKIIDESIVNDYQNYIQHLSPKEKRNLGPAPVFFFEDNTGQHAIQIKIGINGTSWEHVLIYNKDNKRIKTIKYSTGSYRS